MKKFIVILLALALMFSFAACGNVSEDPQTDANAPAEEETPGKVAIITNTVSATEEEYRSAEQMVEKYEGRVIHEIWPENATKEQEQMITVFAKLAADPEIKAIVVNAAVPGTNAAIDKLHEVRDDVLVISCNFSENPPDVAKRADVALLGDVESYGPMTADQAKTMGAETIVYYSFPRHLAISFFTNHRDSMKARAEEIGLKFVEVTAPDPTGDAGIPGAQQFILEDVPKKVAEYGTDTAFYGTSCPFQIPMIQKAVELKAIYVLPCCPSPLHGYPIAMGLDIPEDKKGDIQYVIDATSEKLNEAGVAGRFSNFPAPGSYMLTVTGIEYALRYLDGETNGKFDQQVLEEIMENYTGVDMKFRLMEDSGVTYDNVLLYLQDFIVY